LRGKFNEKLNRRQSNSSNNNKNKKMGEKKLQQPERNRPRCKQIRLMQQPRRLISADELLQTRAAQSAIVSPPLPLRSREAVKMGDAVPVDAFRV
jgi:hypothetical protein